MKLDGMLITTKVVIIGPERSLNCEHAFVVGDISVDLVGQASRSKIN
jgi:hypothetical protein